MSLKQIAGLATHIASLVVEQEAFTCPTCGSAIHLEIGSWSAIQHQVQGHLDACESMRAVGVVGAVTKLTSHRIAEDITMLRPPTRKPERADE